MVLPERSSVLTTSFDAVPFLASADRLRSRTLNFGSDERFSAFCPTAGSSLPLEDTPSRPHDARIGERGPHSQTRAGREDGQGLVESRIPLGPGRAIVVGRLGALGLRLGRNRLPGARNMPICFIVVACAWRASFGPAGAPEVRPPREGGRLALKARRLPSGGLYAFGSGGALRRFGLGLRSDRGLALAALHA